MKETLFKKLLDSLKKEHTTVKEEYKYIGTGNPLSEILIIGKEAGLSIEADQYRYEIVENFNFWNNNDNYDAEQIEERSNYYSPLYPYKGQILRKDDRQGNWGTSTTWMNYQKLYNYIFDTEENNKINFHEQTFITEVNSTPSKKTIDANTSSIEFRKKHLLASKYIKNYPVVIISGVGYFNAKKEENEIEKIFEVTFSEKRFAGNKKSQPYWIHWNDDKTKLVINTYQLSISIADDLLREVAEVIRHSKLINNLPITTSQY
ncbi:hypothetical protein ACXR6G_11520 [Ancylomarina sp. YFZ004]